MKITIEQIAEIARLSIIQIANHGTPDAIEIKEEQPDDRGKIGLSIEYNYDTFTSLWVVFENGATESDVIHHAD